MRSSTLRSMTEFHAIGAYFFFCNKASEKSPHSEAVPIIHKIKYLSDITTTEI